MQSRSAVGYVRVSTDLQVKDGHSIDAQKQSIFDYCRYQKLDFDRFYVDAGLSGKDMERPDLQQMLSDLKPGTVVVATAVSRISRSVKDLQTIIEIIKDKKCSLTLLDLNVDTSTPLGDFMLNVMAAISQFERKQTAERISQTMQHMSRNGTLITKPKYGYKIIKDDDGKSVVIECPEEQAVIDLIRNIVKDDPSLTVSAIARTLQARGIKMRKSKQVYPNVINKIIIDNNLRPE